MATILHYYEKINTIYNFVADRMLLHKENAIYTPSHVLINTLDQAIS